MSTEPSQVSNPPQDAPAISVVIPARNAQATLGQTLDSVQAQEFPRWEVIVVDDGSTDDTRALVLARAAQDPRIRCVPGPRRGVSAARNAGVAQASAPTLAFLDADDLWLPGKLQAHLRFLALHPHVGLSFDRILFVDAQAQSTGVVSTAHVHGLAQFEYLYENPSCTASTLVVRRRAFEQVGAFDETMRFAEDLELIVRIRCTTEWGVEGLDEIFTHYRASPGGASSSLDAMQSGWETLMDKVRGYAPQLVRQHIRRARAVHLRYLARRALRLDLPPPEGLRWFARAVCSHPGVLLREPRRTYGTLAGLMAQAASKSISRLQRA